MTTPSCLNDLNLMEGMSPAFPFFNGTIQRPTLHAIFQELWDAWSWLKGVCLCLYIKDYAAYETVQVHCINSRRSLPLKVLGFTREFIVLNFRVILTR